jgi:hypothetical protein
VNIKTFFWAFSLSTLLPHAFAETGMILGSTDASSITANDILNHSYGVSSPLPAPDSAPPTQDTNRVTNANPDSSNTPVAMPIAKKAVSAKHPTKHATQQPMLSPTDNQLFLADGPSADTGDLRLPTSHDNPEFTPHSSKFGRNAPLDTSSFLTATEGSLLSKKGHYKVRIADTYVREGRSALKSLPKSAIVFFNADTETIGAASNREDAQALTERSPTVYFALKGDTLQETLKRWAEQAGYGLRWNADHDFILNYSYTFHGPFAESGGVMDQVLESFKHNPYAARAVITKNNVVLIQNNTFQPSTIVKG